MTRRARAAPIDTIATRLRAHGARATPARVQVLRLLAGADQALTHREIETRLGNTVADRVTLYRVLEWLVQEGFAHRVTDGARVFRFSVAGDDGQRHEAHGHFRCGDCGRVYCLSAVPSRKPRVPRGFRVAQVDINVSGQCAGCADARR